MFIAPHDARRFGNESAGGLYVNGSIAGSGLGFHGPGLIFIPGPDQLDDVQQVVQDIRPVPELMLFPYPGCYLQS